MANQNIVVVQSVGSVVFHEIARKRNTHRRRCGVAFIGIRGLAN